MNMFIFFQGCHLVDRIHNQCVPTQTGAGEDGWRVETDGASARYRAATLG